MIQHVLTLFSRPAKHRQVEQNLEEDYDLMEAHRRLLNQTTAIDILEREAQEQSA